MEELYTDIVNGLAERKEDFKACYDELISLSGMMDDEEKLAYTMLTEVFKGLFDMTADDWIVFFQLPIMNWIGNHSKEELQEAAPRLAHYAYLFTSGIEESMEKNATEITEEKETEAAE